MLFSKVKDVKARKLLKRNEYKLKCEKYVFINILSKLHDIIINKKLNESSILKSLYFESKYKKRFTKTRLIRRCVLTDRTKAVNRSFNLSRNIFRNMLQFGLVPGYKKAVW